MAVPTHVAIPTVHNMQYNVVVIPIHVTVPAEPRVVAIRQLVCYYTEHSYNGVILYTCKQAVSCNTYKTYSSIYIYALCVTHNTYIYSVQMP